MAVFVENMEYEDPDSFGHDIVMGFEKGALFADWGVDVHPMSPAEQEASRYESYMMEHRYSAAFILGFALDDPWVAQMNDVTIPTVLLDNYIPGNHRVCFIGTDCEEAFDLAVSHLVSLRHEKIAFLNGSFGSYISDYRMASYLQSLHRYGLKADPNLAVYGYYVAESAAYHVPGLIARGATAILCGNDLIASGVIACCRDLGCSVPEDISVIGFDDLPPAASFDPPLTTIRQDRFQTGKCAFYTLNAMVDHVPLCRNMLRPSLIVRESTAIARPRLAERCEPDKDSILYVNPQLFDRYAK